jgi:uncharacterized protein (UPF0332 family)
MSSARDRLALARAALDAGFAAGALSAAYYAILYAARAALSEEEQNAKSHRGTWSLFAQTLVVTERFDPELAARARQLQRLREAGDYDAREVSRAEAESAIRDASAFLAAVESLLRG